MASHTRRQASRVFEVIAKARNSVKAKIADGASRLIGISDRLKISDQEWSALGEYVTQHVACVLAMRPSTSMAGDILEDAWNRLQFCVQQIEEACSARLERVTVVNVAFADEDVQKIVILRRIFDDAFGLFKLNLDLLNFTEAESFLRSLNIDQLAYSIIARVKEDLLPQALEALPYASSASWDPTKVCLPATRVEMIDQMWNFINAADGATCAQIFWLVDVAGSGKTAIAHSVCKKAHEAGLLVTSFFFDRMSAERNNPDKFVTTMARDLASRDKHIAMAMAAALARDAGLRSASVSRQFNDLIAQPSVTALAARQQPQVIVLDALDEGLTPEEQLTAILTSGVRTLPGNFRVLVTSRPVAEIAYAFGNVDHIQKHTINLRGTSNQDDIRTYMTHRLVEVASKRRRKIPWPEPSLALQLLRKSEGHFLWVSTVTQFLGRATNPDRQLHALLSLKGAPNTEAKMDQIYAAVLQACPWGDDDDFVHGYAMYMGTVIAAKQPLTANAMQKLHGGTDHPRDIFEKLGCLITGFDVDDEAVRPLHLSLQEYLTLRAPLPYHLVTKEHSATLAVLCLRVLNRELALAIPSLDAFSLDDPTGTEIPNLTVGMISEPLHYAAHFWPVHLSDVVHLSTDTKECLQWVLETHFIRWIKLCVCTGRYPSLRSIRDWLHKNPRENDMLVGFVYGCQLASNLTDIAWRLKYNGRREEALSAAEDAVAAVQHILTEEFGMHQSGQQTNAQVQDAIFQELVCRTEDLTSSHACGLRSSASSSLKQNSYYRALANSLTVFATCLSNMGYLQRGLEAIEKAVELYRYLTKNQDLSLMPDLAKSLNAWSILQGNIGRPTEALNTIEEAIQLERVLVQQHATAFTPVLAGSLNSLSNRLSAMGRREEALKAIQEAVQLQRVLVQEHAASFTPSLAASLNNLSIRLGDMGRREEALKAIQEAVQLRRVLVQEHPIAFTPVLVTSLNNLSNRLGEMGRREEALTTIEEAVQLHRVLVQQHAAAFTPGLAHSLNTLFAWLNRMGRHEAALKAIEEAVQLQRVLVQEHSAAFTPDLATYLNNLSCQLGELGRSEEALKTIEEAIQLQRLLVKDHARAATPSLAGLLDSLSDCLAGRGRRDEALKAIEESVHLCRLLVLNQAAAFTPMLAHCLNTLSNRLGDVGRGEEGLKASDEAIQLYRTLIQTRAATFNPELASSLYNQSYRWTETGRHQEALASAQEAHDLHRVLAAERPAVFNRQFKNSLERLSQIYAALGGVDQSVIAGREAEEVQPMVQ